MVYDTSRRWVGEKDHRPLRGGGRVVMRGGEAGGVRSEEKEA